MYVFVTLNILQSQFIEKGFKESENSEQNVVLLLWLFTLDKNRRKWKKRKKKKKKKKGVLGVGVGRAGKKTTEDVFGGKRASRNSHNNVFPWKGLTEIILTR